VRVQKERRKNVKKQKTENCGFVCGRNHRKKEKREKLPHHFCHKLVLNGDHLTEPIIFSACC
jgi:hypothetical protein